MTAADLRDEVLRELNVLAVGQSAPNDVAEVIDNLWTRKYAQLRADGHAPFSSNDIDDRFVEPLVKYLAGEAASKFGYRGAALQEKKLIGTQAYKELLEQAIGKKRFPTKADFF